ncbi:unnamed protein product [Gongylonema pulchrum]|uniref:Periphilin-1 n=1 Tax=Gongylonema pulchrum TaxID=637853 RepID=A0A183ET02_9BILA|nr:unnamed protein product [Gongylonema pulchrum]
MVLMTTYKDPQFEKGYVFAARRLPGAIDVPRTLKDTKLDPREPYRPQIGFSRDVPRKGLSDAGRRMVSHSMDSRPRPLSSVPFQPEIYANASLRSNWPLPGRYPTARSSEPVLPRNQFHERGGGRGEWRDMRQHQLPDLRDLSRQVGYPRMPHRYEPYPDPAAAWRMRNRNYQGQWPPPTSRW